VIAKITKGKGFRGALGYLLHGKQDERTDRGVILATNLAGNTPRQMSNEFGAFRRLRTRLGVAVCHTSLSLSHEDRQLSDKEFSRIAQRYLKEMGFEGCPFVVVRHHDTEHQHIHILAGRIKPDGSVVSDKQDFQRAEEVVRQLEKEFGLRAVPPSRPINDEQGAQQQLYGGDNMKQEIQRLLNQAYDKTNDLGDFLSYCKESGISLKPHIQGRRVNGIALEWKGRRVKGSELGKDYSWNAIAKRYRYEPDRHLHLLERLIETESMLVTPLQAELPCIEGSQEQREQRRLLLETDYYDRLKNAFADPLVRIEKNSYGLVIHLQKGRLLDKGHHVQALDMSNDEAAKHIVAMGRAKEWTQITFNGNDDFLRLAMEEAMRHGLTVIAVGEHQQKILDELMQKSGKQAGLVLKPTAQAELPEQTDPKPFQAPQDLRGNLQRFKTSLQQTKDTGPSPNHPTKNRLI